MTDVTAPVRRRPGGQLKDEKRVPMSLRLSPALHRRVLAIANENDRSLTQTAELLFDRAFRDQSLTELHDRIERLHEQIERLVERFGALTLVIEQLVEIFVELEHMQDEPPHDRETFQHQRTARAWLVHDAKEQVEVLRSVIAERYKTDTPPSKKTGARAERTTGRPRRQR
jgi:hypothetical protein